MNRSYSPLSYVRLPRMTAPMWVTVSTELVTVASTAVPPPPDVAAATDKLVLARDQLKVALDGRDNDPLVSTAQTLEAQKRLRAGWRSMRNWGLGWMHAPTLADATRDPLRRMMSALFEPHGLKWLGMRRKEVWAESARRLELLDRDGHAQVMTTLGGAEILASVRAAHVRYGTAMGVTEEQSGHGTSVKRAMETVRNAVQMYVARVGLHAAEGDVARAADAEKRLSPLHRVPRRVWKREAEEQEDPKGGEPVGPVV